MWGDKQDASVISAPPLIQLIQVHAPTMHYDPRGIDKGKGLDRQSSRGRMLASAGLSFWLAADAHNPG